MPIHTGWCLRVGVRLEGMSVYRALEKGKIKTSKAQSHAISATVTLNLQVWPNYHSCHVYDVQGAFQMLSHVNFPCFHDIQQLFLMTN